MLPVKGAEDATRHPLHSCFEQNRIAWGTPGPKLWYNCYTYEVPVRPAEEPAIAGEPQAGNRL